jgi:ABC-type sugar transport system ATPase subunit
MTLLEMRGISKWFGGVHALDQVDLTVEAGEIRALVGENGSGKTTLMRILAGSIQPDTGSVEIDGVSLGDLDATARLDSGVGVVFQEALVCPELTVAENMFLGRLPKDGPFVSTRRTFEEASEILARTDFPIGARQRVRSISQDAQHLTEVARVLARRSRVLVFDETTASLTVDHVERLYKVIRGAKQSGAAVVFITHRLHEAFELCDTITVLRDGRTTGTVTAADSSEDEVVRMMVGRSLDNQFFRPPSEKGDVRLEVRDIEVGDVKDISLDVRSGEIVGLGGLVGSGRSTVLEAIYGLTPRQGVVRVSGRVIEPEKPRSSIKAGIGLVPENRRAQGLAMEQSVIANATMVMTGSRRLLSMTSREEETSIVTQLFDRLALKAADADAPMRTLSGGNQQKVVLGRWLIRNPPVLLLDEPTRGIDVGAKREIYDLIHLMADNGTAILLVSSELPELLGLCDRVLILRDGRIAGEFERGVSEEDLAVAMAGVGSTV